MHPWRLTDRPVFRPGVWASWLRNSKDQQGPALAFTQDALRPFADTKGYDATYRQMI